MVNQVLSIKRGLIAFLLFIPLATIGQSTSPIGAKLIKSFEGCVLKAYQCPAKVWTIGYGNTSHAQKGKIITQETAELFLFEDLRRFERSLNQKVKRDLTQYEFDALIGFTFNLGAGIIKDNLLKNINRGSPEVPEQLKRYNKARVNGVLQQLRGLTRRRITEARLYQTGRLIIEK